MPTNITSESLLEFISSQGQLYVGDLIGFLKQNKLDEHIGRNFDHIAIKARDTSQYERLVQAIRPISGRVVYIEMNNRRLGSAELSIPISLPPFGPTYFVELMEPRPEKACKDFVGLEHSEIYVSDLGEIEDIARQLHIEYQAYANDVHNALVFKINNRGQEIKFTDTTHEEVLAREMEFGKLKSA